MESTHCRHVAYYLNAGIRPEMSASLHPICDTRSQAGANPRRRPSIHTRKTSEAALNRRLGAPAPMAVAGRSHRPRIALLHTFAESYDHPAHTVHGRVG